MVLSGDLFMLKADGTCSDLNIVISFGCKLEIGLWAFLPVFSIESDGTVLYHFLL